MQGPWKDSGDAGAVVRASGEGLPSLSSECQVPWAFRLLGYITHLELLVRWDPRNGYAVAVLLNTGSWATCAPSVQSNPKWYQGVRNSETLFRLWIQDLGTRKNILWAADTTQKSGRSLGV